MRHRVGRRRTHAVLALLTCSRAIAGARVYHPSIADGARRRRTYARRLVRCGCVVMRRNSIIDQIARLRRDVLVRAWALDGSRRARIEWVRWREGRGFALRIRSVGRSRCDVLELGTLRLLLVRLYREVRSRLLGIPNLCQFSDCAALAHARKTCVPRRAGRRRSSRPPSSGGRQPCRARRSSMKKDSTRVCCQIKIEKL